MTLLATSISAKTIINYLSFLFVRSLVLAIEYSPQKIGFFISKTSVLLILSIGKRFKRVGQRNLQLVFPEKSKEERDAILKESYEVLARNIFTFARLPHYKESQIKEMFDFSEFSALIQQVRTEQPNVGIIFPTLHFGCFELFVQSYARLTANKVHILARNFEIEALDNWWNMRREAYGNRVFPRKGAYKLIEKRLKEGEDVTLLIDQNVKRNHAAFVNFFKIPAATTKTVSLASMRTSAPVIICCAAEISPNKFKVYAQLIKAPNTQNCKEDEIAYHISQMHEFIEKVIIRHPEQWFWIHRRFKTRPAGEGESLYEN